MNYKVIDLDSYYRKGVFRHFSEDCKCSTSMTARIDVSELVKHSRQTGTKFYINFLYILSRVLNSRDDYKMGYIWQTNELICYDFINPTQYILHEDTETCTPVYTTYHEDTASFIRRPRRTSPGPRRPENTALIRRTTPTGLTPPISPGFPTIL